ncbi:MAG: hypothetical protein J4F37_07555 [Acidobacteria bacterium]|nr:hypothetical protein [Acidobacteriota bacterium]
MNDDARCGGWRGTLLPAAFAAGLLAAVASAGPVARGAGPAGLAGAQAVRGGPAAAAQAVAGGPAAAAQAVPGAPAAGAGAATATGSGRGSIEAIRCWRRVGRNAVYVGERFDLLVTCSVAETAAARAVPDLAGLDPESLGVSPFEVLEGQRYADLVRGPRRFFQYRYTLRIIGEEYFGADVELPPLDVRYRIERSLDGDAATAGRELTYVLPPEPVRVLALVPAEGADIRELPGETFGEAEARLFRANLTALGAAVLALAAVAAALAAGLGLYRARGGTPAGAAMLPEWRVADGALGEIAAVRQAVGRDGWSMAEVGRALAAFRVAGAVALGRPPAQSTAEGGTQVGVGDDRAGVGRAGVDRAGVGRAGVDRVGQLLVRRGGGRAGGVVCISSATTPERLERALPELRSRRPRDVHLAETVRDALRLFGAVRYGRPADVPGAPLTEQLDRAAGALADRAREGAPAVRRIGALRRVVEAWERAWGR